MGREEGAFSFQKPNLRETSPFLHRQPREEKGLLFFSRIKHLSGMFMFIIILLLLLIKLLRVFYTAVQYYLPGSKFYLIKWNFL